MDARAREEFLRRRRHSGRSFVIGGLLAAGAVVAFVGLGGELSLGLKAPDVRIDAARVLAE
jgi:hypothetical protein